MERPTRDYWHTFVHPHWPRPRAYPRFWADPLPGKGSGYDTYDEVPPGVPRGGLPQDGWAVPQTGSHRDPVGGHGTGFKVFRLPLRSQS